jgi:alpha-tubulin suppressor-like RCC1 family protein
MGQLGDGTYQPRGIATNVRVTWQTNPYAARVASMASSWNQRCAILTDRRVACWGSKHIWFAPTSGYKSDTTLEPKIVPGLQDVVDLYVGPSMACALQRTGSVWCWGNQMVSGQFVNGVSHTDIPQMHVLTDVIAVSHGGSAVTYCLTKMTNVATCYGAWSGMVSYQTPTGGTVSDVGQVSSGHLSSCVLKQSNGQVWCWGDNTYFGQLGIGASNIQTSVPQQVMSLNTVQLLAQNGSYTNCALLADSSVNCWGQAIVIDGVNSGNAGAGGSSMYATPVAIPNSTEMRQISTGMMSCGVKYNGTVWCWGVPKWDVLGSITPWQIIGITDAVAVNVSADNNSNTCVLRINGEMRCWGMNVTGMLADGTTTYRSVHRPISEPWQANVNQGCEWVDWQGRRHRYESLSDNWTWTQASDIAAARTWRGNNGYLATITSPEENRCVHQLFMKQEQRAQWPGMMNGLYPRRWLGGSDADSEGTWKWLVGPEAGTIFRRNLGSSESDVQPGYSQFQATTDGCKPDCTTYPDWDYTQIFFPQGTHIQRNTWNDQSASDNESGALVEYTTGTGETARTYTTTTDSQGNYSFAGLAPGIYTVQSTTHGTASSQRVVIWPDQRDVRVDFVNRNVTTSLRQTATAAAIPTQTATRTMTVTPQPTIASATTWEFDTLSGNSAASTTSANNSATFYCGTNYHATMLCPSNMTDNGTSYIKFNGTQFMSSQAPISETNNLVRIRFRSPAVYATPVGIYGVVENFNANGFGGHDREIYLDRGKVCSRIVRESADIICSTWRYDDGQWHVIERSYGGTNPFHRLRVDNETVLGSLTSSIFTSRRGQIIGMSGNSTWYSFFSGDIDYVITASAP